MRMGTRRVQGRTSKAKRKVLKAQGESYQIPTTVLLSVPLALSFAEGEESPTRTVM